MGNIGLKVMVIDSNEIQQDGKVFHSDICIVGAGAAGITIAKEFIKNNVSVSLLESGGFNFDRKVQSLYKGTCSGIEDSYLQTSRLRYFGGTTNHWGGWCRPMDVIDFEKRDELPFSGWPFARNHLEQYYQRAYPLLEIKPFGYDIKKLYGSDRTPITIGSGDRVTNKVYHYSPPTRFGKIYRDTITDAKNINLFLNANVVDIQTDSSGTTINRVQVASLNGSMFWMKPKILVLATGGIENARLLLLSNSVQKNGLGNQNDLVGRFFMEHPRYSGAGLILLSKPNNSMKFYKIVPEPALGHKTLGVLCIKEDIIRQQKLLNLSAEIHPAPFSALSDISKSLVKTTLKIDHLPSAGKPGKEIVFLGYITIRSEQAPNPNSRVRLTQELDELGKRRVHLDLKLTDLDFYSIQKSIEIITKELGSTATGRIKLILNKNNYTKNFKGGKHHIGTTRMHIDPRQGVVDENCKIHGLTNLYIAGSSVFPTGGFANPTLTIVALSLRLSDHIKSVLKI